MTLELAAAEVWEEFAGKADQQELDFYKENGICFETCEQAIKETQEKFNITLEEIVRIMVVQIRAGNLKFS